MGSSGGLIFFGGCSPPYSLYCPKRGGEHTELATCGLWGPSVHSLYPRHVERQTQEKREGCKEREKEGSASGTGAVVLQFLVENGR